MLSLKSNLPGKVSGLLTSRWLLLIGSLIISLSGITQHPGYTWKFGSAPPFVSTALSGATGSHTLTLLGDGAQAITVENESVGLGTSCTGPINVGEYGGPPNYYLFGLQFNNNPQFISNEYTIEMVVKFLPSGNYHRLMGFYNLTNPGTENSTSDYGIYITPDSDPRIIFYNGTTSYMGEETVNAINANTWYHIVFVRSDDKNIKVYVNGVLIETFADTDDHFLPHSGISSNAITFFKDEGSQEVGGSIAKLGIYSSDEISVPSLFNNICADIQAPSSFTLSSPGQTANTINLSWTAATDNVGVTGYDVYVGGVLNGNTTNTTYTVNGLTPSTQYSIYVKTKDAADNGTNSNTIMPTTAASSGNNWSLGGNANTDPINNFLGTTDNQPLIVRTNNTEAFRVTSTGQVAIGATNPYDHKLAVGGSIIATKVKVKELGSWPDFVFDKEYKLPSLHEIEKYIKEHKHLPGIPSAKQVGEMGIDVGDQQALLLQKIEELTLYLIEINKQVEKLTQENEILKRKIDKANKKTVEP